MSTGADLAALGELDQKLWVALACPVDGLEFDRRTLELIDTDHDRRIRAPDLIAAAEWATSMVKDMECFARPEATLPIDNIDDTTEEGQLLLRTAKELLASLGKPEAPCISVEDTTDAFAAFSKQPFNGDGVLPAASAPDPVRRQAIEDILKCVVPAADRGGEPGLTRETLAHFFKEASAHTHWLDVADADPTIRPLGADTVVAYSVFSSMRAKIDDYFTRVQMASYDPRATAAINGDERSYAALGTQLLAHGSKELEPLPLARVEPGKPLPLDRGINPAWAPAMAAFRAQVVLPVLGEKGALTEADWHAISAKFASFDAWARDKAGASVEKLGPARVRELAASSLEADIGALIDRDRSEEPVARAIERVETLVRLRRDLMKLANNFVSFRDFYSGDREAIFQAGVLYLDTRACELVLPVVDAERHIALGPHANMYLLYCDCRNAMGQTRSIVAAMTAGDVDNLMVGRNGVFYDRGGIDWDATVTKIIENSISLRQAFWAPYKKAIRIAEEQIAKRTSAMDSDVVAKLPLTLAPPPAVPVPGAPPIAPQPAAAAIVPARRIDVGTVAALGVAAGGLTAALGVLLQAFFGLGIWMPLGLLAVLLAISGPSMAVAWLKLRKRNLGPLLDANGWAVNAQARVNVPLGEALTSIASLPEGASRDLVDPFAERRSPWRAFALLALLLALGVVWWSGRMDEALPHALQKRTLLPELTPVHGIGPPS